MTNIFPGGNEDPANLERWIAYKEKGRSQILGAVTLLGMLGIVGGTIVLLAWSPWN